MVKYDSKLLKNPIKVIKLRKRNPMREREVNENKCVHHRFSIDSTNENGLLTADILVI